LRDKK